MNLVLCGVVLVVDIIIIGVLAATVYSLRRDSKDKNKYIEVADKVMTAQSEMQKILVAQNEMLRKKGEASNALSVALISAIAESYSVVDCRTFLKTRADRAIEEYKKCVQD